MKNSTVQFMLMLIIILAFQTFTQISFAQAPQKMSYQAVIRNSANQLVTNKMVGMRISILQGSEIGTAVYTETQTPTTNANGLATIGIGAGITSNDFSTIDWAIDPYFIKTETDPSGGTNYSINGVSQLLSVPYALQANGLTLPFSKTISNADQAFKVTNTIGTAISGRASSATGYSCGVLGSTSAPDGFGVFGTANTAAMMGEAFNLTGTTYGVIGTTHSTSGCSLWGNNTTETGSTTGVLGEVYSSSGTGVKGYSGSTTGTSYGVYGTAASTNGFGVYGSSPYVGVRGISTGKSGSGVSGTGVNIGVGGSATGTSGQVFALIGETQSPVGYGVFGGSYSYTGTTYGVYGKVNSPDGFSGYFDGGKFFTNSKVGIGTTTPEFDIDVYKLTGSSTLRLKSATSGALIILDQVNNFNNNFSFIIFRKQGVNAFMTGMNYDEYMILSSSNSKGLSLNSDGYVRISERLSLNDGGRIGIGTTTPGAALHVKGTGFPNSFIFLEAAAANDAGFRIYEGAIAKWHIYNNAGAGGLNICNSNFATALFAKQSNSFVGINTTTPNYNLEVNGTAGKTGGGSWSNSSDIRLKTVTGKYSKGLNEITALQPIIFNYKEGNARNLPSNKQQIGFVAQDVQKIFPEAVTKADDGYLDFNIHAINVALVNAVKELKAENDKLKAESEKLKAENQLLKSKDEQIDSRLTNLEKIIGTSAMK
jgi:hypothetical protein